MNERGSLFLAEIDRMAQEAEKYRVEHEVNEAKIGGSYCSSARNVPVQV